MKKSILVCVAVLMLVGVFAPCWAGGLNTSAWRRTWGWDWQLPNDRYQLMSVFERAQYDKAARFFFLGNYKASTAEFDKLRVEFPDSSVSSYILFMNALSLHQAKTRNQAIELYNEVLDFYASEVSDAAPAIFFMGMAHIDNGDTAPGIRKLEEMIANELYRKHPLAAGAMRYIGDAYWNSGEEERAIAVWKRLVKEFASTGAGQVADAKRNLTAYYVHNQQFDRYERWAVTDANRENQSARVEVVENACDVTFDEFHQTWRYPDKKFKPDEFTALLTYLRTQKGWYEKSGALWSYYKREIGLLSEMIQDRKSIEKVVTEALGFSEKNPESADKRLVEITDSLRRGGDFQQASRCIAKMKDRHLATFKEYEVAGLGQEDWAAAIRKLLQLENMNDSEWATRAVTARAWVLKDHLKKYEEAIQLYRQLNAPPKTLWAIQECYIRWKKLSEAIRTLREIENFFPDDAPNAAWKIATYYHEAKESKKAIAAARRILKVYPKSQASSRAHQLLEKYDIATGGGLLDESN